MCKLESKLKFCTCLVNGSNRKVRRKDKKLKEGKIFKWRLYKYVEEIDRTMDGMLYQPSAVLGNLTNEYLVMTLNNEVCFDFEYVPKIGDNLIIYIDNNYNEWLSFIYKINGWEADSYDGFIHKTEKINNGKIIQGKKNKTPYL